MGVRVCLAAFPDKRFYAIYPSKPLLAPNAGRGFVLQVRISCTLRQRNASMLHQHPKRSQRSQHCRNRFAG
jgi:hypothetical protein